MLASVTGVSTPASFALTNTASVSSSGGIALIQQGAAANPGNNQHTLTVTLPNAPTGSNILVLMFDQTGASQAITAITGATWTRISQNNTTNNGDSEIWVGTNPSSSTITITGTNYFGGFQPGYAIAAEFAGVSSVLDGSPVLTTSGIWPVTTGSLSTTNANDLLLTSTLSYNGGGVNATVRSPWTPFTPPAATYSLSAGFQTVNATGSYSAIWNGSGSPQVATTILALKASAALLSASATAGTPQSASVNTAFNTALQVTIKDANNNPVSGATVTFTAPATGAGASFSGSATATATTNVSGIATAPTLTANSQAGVYSINASAAGVSTPASFSLTNLAGTPATIASSSGTPQSTAVSTTFAAALQATVKDANNNPVSGITVTFTAPASGASAAFSGLSATTATTNVNGVATAPSLTANSQAGSYTVSASIPGLSSVAGFALSNTPPPPASVSAGAGTPQSATVNATFSTALQATVKDANNNPVSGVVVTFTAPANGPSATFNSSATAIATTNASGIATTPALTANTQAGSYSVTATVPGISTPATFALSNIAGPAASISATSGTPQSTTISSLFPTALQATVKDAYNNPVSGLVVTFAAPVTGVSASFSGSATSTATTNSNGTANAPALTANGQAGSYTITASAAGLSASASFALTNITAPPASITPNAGTPQSTTVTTAFNTTLQATVKDANNNPVSGVMVTFTAPSTGASATFNGSASTNATTNASGIATAPALTANSQAGSFNVTAAASGVATAASFSLTNLAGAVANISATAGTPQSATESTSFLTALQATVKDANNNPVSGVSVTFTAPAAGASAAFNGSVTATVTTNLNGVATAPMLTANAQAGSFTVSAAVAGVSTPASFSLTNNAPVTTIPISLVQQASGANLGNNQNTLTISLKNAPAGNDVLILIFDQTSASQTITSITGATWTRLAQNYTSNNGDSEIWVGANPTSASIKITGANYFGTFQPGYAVVAEFAGVSTTLDGSPLNTTSGIWPVTTATLSSTSAPDLLLTSTLSYNGGGVNASVAGPWALLAAPSGTYSLAAAYQIANSPGSYSASWNGAGSPQVATIILALKPAGSN